MSPARLAAAPLPPGSLTAPPAAGDVLAYLDALDKWTVALRDALDALDASAQLAKDPGAYTQDVVLAMSLWHSIDARRQELEKVWDSGRVLQEQLAQIATLLWGRLTDPLGAPSAFTLPEACTLAAAVHDRLTAQLAGDAIAGSGAAARIEPLRAAIERCRRQATALGIPTVRIDALSAGLEAAVGGSDPKAIAAAVDRIDAEITITETDLIKEASTRAGLSLQGDELRRRYDDLAARARALPALAARCREKIAKPPVLGLPSIDALGEPPAASAGDDWDTSRRELEAYAQRLGRFGAAITFAEQRFNASLEERDDLRGLLGAYRNRVAAKHLDEDAALADKYDRARDVLFTAPCDLATARALVADYQHAVRLALGADAAVEVNRESR